MNHVELRIQDGKDKQKPLYPELREAAKVGTIDLQVSHVSILQGGMQSGKASISLMAVDKKGQLVHLEISADMYQTISAALSGARQRWGEADNR